MADHQPDQPNEILEAAAAAKAAGHAADARTADPAKTGHWPMRIIGVGIGSAAVAAAVLFANSGRKKKKG
ncbi:MULTISPECIES: hypothetical protein [unclassified Sphingomonas]|jgi:hypothetical protein|uniref:hypothetical protein n=1 Tax=unclassified Sphingomonas TaxID=196159 RepID=UPI000E103950|nr:MULTISPECIES: hypothetical protein [unclassified Sphingomonas]AXJ95637.1 hypothetical protein DM480_09050 [Sphingomonas sp. FARSPH]